jgi:cyclase
MINTRIIGVINIFQDIAVQSIKFKKFLPIGKPKILIDYYQEWGVDEIILLDIKSSITKNSYFKNNLKYLVRDCNTPLTIGGGISTIKDIDFLFNNGADKVTIGSSIFTNNEIVKQASKIYGKQAIIACLDIKKKKFHYELFIKSGTEKIQINVENYIKKFCEKNVGEIMINSITNDGMKNGYDLNLIKLVKKYTNLPLIICGGAGKPEHYINPINLGVSGLAAGNFLNFKELTIKKLKIFLKKKNKKIR